MRKLLFCTVLLVTTNAFPQSNKPAAPPSSNPPSATTPSANPTSKIPSSAFPPSTPPINWHLMDQQKDGYQGISLERAYEELLNKKKPLKKIIVAILDDGLDDEHPDLAGMEWTNMKEIPGNNIDDDHNGFTDDIHGWNFIGGMTNESVEPVREYVRLRGNYEGKADSGFFAPSPGYLYWVKIVAEKNAAIGRMRSGSMTDYMASNTIQLVQKYWSTKTGKDSIYIRDIKEQKPDAAAGPSLVSAHNMVLRNALRSKTSDSVTLVALARSFADRKTQDDEDLYNANTLIAKGDAAYFRKKQLGDDPYVNNMANYGDGVTFPLSPAFSHGTECAGVIAGLRNNGRGGNGITNSVAIMPVKICASEDADEWDKDVANAIRYAVDNGAQVINMSFAKYISPQKSWVDEAVRYAEKKGALLVVAAGNQSTNNDSLIMYTDPFYADGSRASNLIKVGTSNYDSTLVAAFSCYGAKTVDIFAPGEGIYTSTDNGGYRYVDGTSYSTPVVAGIAALIWSYYPDLSYRQVKYCIERSAAPIATIVTRPGTKQRVPFSSLSRTGGIVNAYVAVKLAEEISKKK
jgi:subtilisin family serine protease